MNSRFQDLSADHVQLRPPSTVSSASRVSRRTLLLSGAALVAVVPAAGAQQLSGSAPQTPPEGGATLAPITAPENRVTISRGIRRRRALLSFLGAFAGLAFVRPVSSNGRPTDVLGSFIIS